MSGVIHLQTEIPGPRSRVLLRAARPRRTEGCARGYPDCGRRMPKVPSLRTLDGNRFIDFGGGIGVVNTGGIAILVSSRRCRRQLDQFAHVCFPVSTYEPYVELAERLNRITVRVCTTSEPSSSTAAPKR